MIDGDWRNFVMKEVPPSKSHRRLTKALHHKIRNERGWWGRRRRHGRAVHRALRKLGRI